MMLMAPERIPADPAPATARPPMNIFELVAAAQSVEPRRKMVMKVKKAHFSEKRV